MALAPQAAALLAALAGMPAPDYSRLDAASYRAAIEAGRAAGTIGEGDAVAAEEDLTLPGAAGPLAARLYRPVSQQASLPLVVFFHGGGFVACGIDTHANLCRTLAARANVLVLSVDYRLAPEARFPAAAHDALAAVRWAAAHAAQLGAIPGALAVAGDSAGGNLAAVCAQQLQGEVAIAHQLLLYPVVDCSHEHPSYETYGSGYLLDAGLMRWFKDQYFESQADRASPLASPLGAERIEAIAPATIVSAECDALRDESERYAERLSQAGVPVTHVRWPGQMHGFASMIGVLDAANAALDLSARALRAALHP
ncbi:Acetyl esterase [Paraburkholderia caffeinitolerans]|uniref:Acetyl esterase n=1 Tax=Paraburkholderia caffeinitolerans TaxID=1723730 RepID=A0A6J5FSI3_9BURK|nr:alpha/beta hydrolase [Paraburkholderia caffeinitolerans]CAB3785954.1 Acetyl esterase [Paraburkholderia caffeinitolerans]